MAFNCSNTNTNTTTGDTTECQNLLKLENVISPTERVVAFSLVYGILFILSLVGNTIVCVVIFRNRDMRTVTNAFLVNLAVCDITFAIVNVPPLLALEILPTYWIFGDFMCRLVPFCSTATTSASIYTMVAIAIDRRHAITNPLEVRMLHTRKRTMCVILFVWFISLTAATPNAVTQTLLPYHGQLYCTENWHERGGELGNKVYTIVLFVFLFVIPIVLMTTSYIKITTTLWATNTALARDYSHATDKKDYQSTAVATAVAKKSNRRDPQSSQQNKRKTTLMLLTVVILFLICMLPFNILSLLMKFLDPQIVERNAKEFALANSVLVVLLVSSCAWNPFIYNFFSQKFNRAFSRVFKCQCESRADEQETISTVLGS